jgi:hypothetical protein
MPRRSVKKLLEQMADFDAEFAGSFQDGALRFNQVLTDARLLNTFCNALPGETLAALQRARSTLYWRVRADAACQPWQFEPLAAGAPLGTWKRVRAQSAQDTPLSFHYLQAAEEIRLVGPVVDGSGSNPTDRREWACEANFRMIGVDANSIQLEQGRWFFSRQACDGAPASEATFPGCVSGLAAPAG